MATFSADNFGNDGAQGYLAMLTAKLVATIKEVVADHATRIGMPYVNHRWLGGMLTNFSTISKRLLRLRELREMERSRNAA